MTDTQPTDPDDQALLDFLDAQRAVVFAILAGLDEEAWQQSVVPSGWTPSLPLFHVPAEVRVLLRRDAPLLLQMRGKPVF